MSTHRKRLACLVKQEAGIFIAHIFSAGGYENLYYVVNKGCGIRVERKKLHDPDYYEDKIPECQCYKNLPILWMVPNYVELDQKSLGLYNGAYWYGYHEYYEAYIDCKVSEYLPPHFDFQSLKKPTDLIPKPLIKIAKFTPPTDKAEKKIEVFSSEFPSIVEQAKNERRILVHSPQIYPNTSQGKREKYGTVAEILRNFQALAQTELFSKYHSDRPRNEWSVWQKSQQKLAIITNEVRAMAPTKTFSGDPESSVSKRAFYNYLPEARHNKSWIVFDLQSPSDMFEGARKQVDIRIVKRSTPMLLGEELKWLNAQIDNRVKFLAENEGFHDIESLPKWFKEILLRRYHISRIEEIPDNYGYILYENGEKKLITFPTPPWHHKDDKSSFQDDTGIKWKYKKITEAKLDSSSSKSGARISKKEQKNVVLQQVDYYIKQGWKFPQVVEKMQELEKSGQNPYTGMDRLSGNTLGNKYRRWVERQPKQ